MKRYIIACLLLFVASNSICADNSITLSGIKYTLEKDNTVSCEAVKKKELVDVQIPSTIRINGLDYYVERIAKQGFAKCQNLKSIEIPNSVHSIGAYAFNDCRNLVSIVMPDDAEAVIPDGNYGYGRYGIFKGCTSLSEVRGHTVMYPRYVVYDAFMGCEEVPFYATILSEGSAKLTQIQMAKSFSEFASSRLKRTIEDWQRRKQYETTAQWEARVNDASRQKMIDETLATLKLEYIGKFGKSKLSGKLGDYVAEYGFFPVELGQMGTAYAAVPQSDALDFKAGWNEAVITPVYGILDDNLAVISCDFTVNGHTYKSYRSYEEDDFSPMTMEITPLSAVKEYELTAQGTAQANASTPAYEVDAIDINIPVATDNNERTFAVIIGNENYQRVAHVDFAANDARIFEKYCQKALGIPETNIRTYFDATYGDIVAAMRDIKEIASVFDGNIKVVFYYAGHGLPDDSNRNAFLLPVDASGNDTEACYPLGKLYEELSSLNAEIVMAFIDACFSGSLRGEGMLASARGIRLKPRAVKATGNLVVLSAASGDQSALPYAEKGHGLFTYYLLNKLNATDGNVSIGELVDYVSEEVSKQSVVVNRRLQTPTVVSSPALQDGWRAIQLR